jgi:hypothetical protein
MDYEQFAATLTQFAQRAASSPRVRQRLAILLGVLGYPHPALLIVVLVRDLDSHRLSC